jgi:hypothetical protein
MEASYGTELQCAGQDKRDTVARGVAHWVKVATDRGQCGRQGVDNKLMDLTSSTKVENLTRMPDQLPRYQVLMVLEKAASLPSTAVSHNGALNALSGSSLTSLMR